MRRLPGAATLLLLAAGLPLVPARAADPAVVGEWATSNVWPLIPIHTNLLPNGKVLVFDSETDSALNPKLWDPASDTWTDVPYKDSVNMFCAGHAPLPNGDIFVAGGHSAGYVGIINATIFHWRDNTWTDVPNMSYARWYPTVTKLPDGRMLVVSGAVNCSDCATPGAPHTGIAAVPEIYDPESDTWQELTTASLRLPLYPHDIVLPDGRVFAAGTQEDPIASRVLDLTTGTWSTVDTNVRDGGSSVMYLPGKILKTGSGRNPDYPTANAAATAWVIDMNQSSPAWRQVASMAYPRTQHTLTLLPTGKVLVTGGATNSDVSNQGLGVLPAEMWDPTTETWTTLASESVPRLYHSVALLLPDGRVALAGGGHPPGFGIAEYRGEIYSPPYLFQGSRPVITSTASTWGYGQTVYVQTPDASSIASVALVAQGAVTHAFNANQRYLPLSFTVTTGGLDVAAPANANLAPPGYYMLFLLNGNGVPSVASWVHFAAPWEDGLAPSAPTDLAATTSLGQVSLTWTASSDNEGVTQYNVHRSTTPETPPTPSDRIGQTTATAFVDAQFSTGTYYYVVTAQDAAGNISAGSNEVTVTATADDVPPTTPALVSVTTPGAGQANLSWTAATDNVGVANYLIERCPGSGCSVFAQVAVALGSATGFLDAGLSASTSYGYRIRAQDGNGNVSGYSNVVTTATPASSGGLVAAYAFNEGAADVANDASGYVNTGNLANGAAWTAQGKFGAALSLPGSPSEVTVADSPSLDMTSQLTLEAWVNPNAPLSGWTAVVDKDVDRYYLMACSDQGNAPAGGGTFSGGNENVYGSAPLPAQTWTHLAFVYDGVAERLYINGVEAANTPQGGAVTTSTNPLHIGADIYGEHFPGLVDEVRIYNRALSPSEIQSDMVMPVASGEVVLAVGKDEGTDSVKLSWTDTAGNGIYAVRRSLGPAPADFSSATCTIAPQYDTDDPGTLHDGADYFYLIDARSACSP